MKSRTFSDRYFAALYRFYPVCTLSSVFLENIALSALCIATVCIHWYRSFLCLGPCFGENTGQCLCCASFFTGGNGTGDISVVGYRASCDPVWSRSDGSGYQWPVAGQMVTCFVSFRQFVWRYPGADSGTDSSSMVTGLVFHFRGRFCRNHATWINGRHRAICPAAMKMADLSSGPA